MKNIERRRLKAFLHDTNLQLARIERNIRMREDLHQHIVDLKDTEIASLTQQLARARKANARTNRSVHDDRGRLIGVK